MTKKKVGGYEFRQHIHTASEATKFIRQLGNRLLTENPGPQTQTIWIAKIIAASADASAAVHEIEKIADQGE